MLCWKKSSTFCVQGIDIDPMSIWFSKRERNAGLSFSNFSWQSVKIFAKESCLYGIIDIRITPFLGVWFIVSSQLYYTISGEELFTFSNKKVPYLCGLWRFANAYIIPFIIEDSKKGFYYRGLSGWRNEKGGLVDTCLDGQDTFIRLLDMLEIPHN